MSDATSSPARLLARQGHPGPLRDGVLHAKELSLADDRTAAYQIIRSTSPAIPDAHGAYVGSDAEAATYVQVTRADADVAVGVAAANRDAAPHADPAPVVGAGNLLLNLPPGGGEVGKD
jgi:hypothetical protein